jgi:hypothetical protein
MEKQLTNEQMLRRLIKELNPLEASIVRERLVKIAEMTMEGIKQNPKAYDNPIYDHSYYEYVCKHIFRVIGFEKHKEHQDGTNVRRNEKGTPTKKTK